MYQRNNISRRLAGSGPTLSPVRRYSVAEGSRSEILTELDQYGSDRAQQGKPEKAREFAAAIAAVEAGADEVIVGHSVYRVVEAS